MSGNATRLPAAAPADPADPLVATGAGGYSRNFRKRMPRIRTRKAAPAGLSITKAIVEAMGGSIGFDSAPNVKTTFHIEFPVVRDAVVVAPAEAGLDMCKRVLICEDDRDIASLLALMLQQNGLASDITYDAAQAKRLLARRSYALMTLDLGLSDQSGIALIRELWRDEKTADLPIMVVSANAHEGSKAPSGDGFSVIDWIGKPIGPAAPLDVVARGVGSGSGWASQRVACRG